MGMLYKRIRSRLSFKSFIQFLRYMNSFNKGRCVIEDLLRINKLLSCFCIKSSCVLNHPATGGSRGGGRGAQGGGGHRLL